MSKNFSKNKKLKLKKFWLGATVVAALLAVGGCSSSDTESTKAANNDTKVEQSVSGEKKVEETTEAKKEIEKTEFYVGDVLEDGNAKITFVASGDYKEENEFMQPAEGKKYIYLQFAVENTSDSSDVSISSWSFECFADGYAMESYYGGEEDLSATLSAGRATTGYLYYEIPADAKEIEVEYEVNAFTDKKVKFIFEGDKDSGYVQEVKATPTEGALNVGDVSESNVLKLTYLSCEEFESDNMFIVPADGHRFITCEFEFENIGKNDEFVSAMDFDCYADGQACKDSYVRDDSLSATISAGRKAKGTVTFEVPIDAEVVEVEYLSNYWTSKRVVFKVK